MSTFETTGLATAKLTGYGRSPAPGDFACTREQTPEKLAQLAAQQAREAKLEYQQAKAAWKALGQKTKQEG